jgi:hypothetical protein
MKVIICLLVFSLNLNAINYEDWETKFYGETRYSKSSSETLRTILNYDYKIKLFEPSHKRYMIHFGGTVSPDYDHFGKTIKVNGFTGFGIDF